MHMPLRCCLNLVHSKKPMLSARSILFHVNEPFFCWLCYLFFVFCFVWFAFLSVFFVFFVCFSKGSFVFLVVFVPPFFRFVLGGSLCTPSPFPPFWHAHARPRWVAVDRSQPQGLEWCPRCWRGLCGPCPPLCSARPVQLPQPAEIRSLRLPLPDRRRRWRLPHGSDVYSHGLGKAQEFQPTSPGHLGRC